MRILVVEDDELIARGIVSGLRAFGMTADRVESVAHAELARQTTHCDAMVLDLGLPDEDGMQLLVRMRQSGDELPVLLLTARDAVEDRIAGLQGGAADYLVKPFDLGELVARLHALSRRAAGRSVNLIEAGSLALDPARGQEWPERVTADLSLCATAPLATLIQAAGGSLSGEQPHDTRSRI